MHNHLQIIQIQCAVVDQRIRLFALVEDGRVFYVDSGTREWKQTEALVDPTASAAEVVRRAS